ncbi:hypothetical protein WMY93_006987 [Mugilogobius chulae]|uniref:Uncharacterized protein n=1 Tax=Mugilogobius chulae TaxID=88201 RepID=A0AAW0PLU7_9GOBI
MSRVRRVSCYTCTPQSPGDIQILERWKAAAHQTLSRAHKALLSVAVAQTYNTLMKEVGKPGQGLVRVHIHKHTRFKGNVVLHLDQTRNDNRVGNVADSQVGPGPGSGLESKLYNSELKLSRGGASLATL